MSGENIPFSNINQVNGVIIGRLFKKARIRIQTELDAVWEIRTSPKAYAGLLNAFHAWKNKQAQSSNLAHEKPGTWVLRQCRKSSLAIHDRVNNRGASSVILG